MSTLTFTDLPRYQYIDTLPLPVIALSAIAVNHDWEHTRHQHRKAQLLYSVRGILKCEVQDGIWLVPPQCAVWIPGGLPHSARGAGETECYCLFVEPDIVSGLPQTCCTLMISPLLHELLLQVTRYPDTYPASGRETRLIATLLDELTAAPIEDLHLPRPQDPRLRRLAEELLLNPADKTSKTNWAKSLAMSERTMSRLLLQETGMSFGRWRRQLHIILALQRLTKGDSVQTVALSLGYENASGFITMFRKALGHPPARYLAARIHATGNPT